MLLIIFFGLIVSIPSMRAFQYENPQVPFYKVGNNETKLPWTIFGSLFNVKVDYLYGPPPR